MVGILEERRVKFVKLIAQFTIRREEQIVNVLSKASLSLSLSLSLFRNDQ